MPTDDPILPAPAAVVVPVPAPAGSKRIVCEICECRLAPDGSAIELSAKFKAMRDRDEKVTDLKAEIDRERTRAENAERELEALKASIAESGAKRRRNFSEGI